MIWTVILFVVLYKICGRRCRNRFRSNTPDQQQQNPIVRQSVVSDVTPHTSSAPNRSRIDPLVSISGRPSVPTSVPLQEPRKVPANNKPKPISSGPVCRFKKVTGGTLQNSQCTISTVSKPTSSTKSKKSASRAAKHKTTKM